jgi:glucokinase
MADDSIVIGADIGGSHITAARVDLVKKQMITGSLTRCTVDSLAAAEQVIAEWAHCIKEAAGQHAASKICLAMPGPFDYATGICLIQDQSKYPMLYGLNVKKLLAEELDISIEDIFIHNDAACFLQGEVFCGPVSEFDKVISVTLGTGLGSAVYENGIAYSADLWKMPFNNGIAEDYLSARWFLRSYASITGDNINGVRELTSLAHANEWVNSLFDEFGKNLSIFLNRFIADTGAKAVVIGGNIAQAFPLFKNTLITGVHSHFPGITIVPSVLGEQAALIGAASIWHHQQSTV